MHSMIRRFMPVVLAIAAACSLLSISARADSLGDERGKAKMILNVVAKEIEKQYYDPALHGVDWKLAVADTRNRIDSAQSTGEMLAAIYGMVDLLHDSHTIFVPPGRTSKITFGFEARMFGDEARIYKVKKKSPAEKAGLVPGDRILQVNGYEAERKNFNLMMFYFRVLAMARTFDLLVQRDSEKPHLVRVTGNVEPQPVVMNLDNYNYFWDAIRELETAAAEEKYFYSLHDDIGYVSLPDFSAEKSFFQGLLGQTKNAKAMIVDLRGNPGGDIDSLATFAGFFEPEATSIADVISRKKTEPIKVKPAKPSFTVPMFILIDSETASSAEIFTHHFRREGRAVVIGDSSAGAVMVARIFPEQIGTDAAAIPFSLGITYGRVVFPGGEELEGKAINPDHRCLPTSKQMRDGDDACLAVAFDLAKKAIAPGGATAAPAK